MMKKGDLVFLNRDSFFDHDEYVGIVLEIIISDIEWFDSKVDECTYAKVAWFSSVLEFESHQINELELINESR
jgi:hypothetical protein